MKVALLLLFAGFAAANPSSVKSCSGPRVRREIRELSQAERDAFFKAFISLSDEGSLDGLVKQHLDEPVGYWAAAHTTPRFLPWHRLYLRQLEDLLRQELGDRFTLPYWDWSLDSQNPGASVILGADYCGGASSSDRSILDSPFANYTVKTPEPHLLKRDYDPNRMSTLFHPSLIQPLMDPRRNFSEMSLDLMTGPHNTFHAIIGGENGDLAYKYSPNDILFWLNHCFIDKLWSNWQSNNGNIMKYDGYSYTSDNFNASANDTLPGFDMPVGFALDNQNLCVSYQDPGEKSISLCTDKNISSVKMPTALPQNWFNDTISNRTMHEAMMNRTKAIANQVNTNLSQGLNVTSVLTKNTTNTTTQLKPADSALPFAQRTANPKSPFDQTSGSMQIDTGLASICILMTAFLMFL